MIPAALFVFKVLSKNIHFFNIDNQELLTFIK